jgi:hypothetical protein
MSLSEFLIVGAMKAGTTSLYADLATHPALFLPEEKEPVLLLSRETDAQVVQLYARLMRPAKPDQKRGEASTGYTKRPASDSCAARAARLLGPDLRILYMQRDPVERAISHYRHDFLEGTVTAPIDEALLHDPKYVDYGCYDWQIAPWLAAFGPDRVLRLSFETYIADRAQVLTKVCSFLGVPPAPVLAQQAALRNASDSKFVARGWRRAVVNAPLFQRHVKPLVPRDLRQRLMPLLFPNAGASPREIAPQTRAALHDRFARDARK